MYLVYSIAHALIYKKIVWITSKEKLFFNIEILILCFFTFIPIILLLILKCAKLTKAFLNVKKRILKILFYISFFNGLIISLILWENAKYLSSYFYECPFHYKIDDLPLIFNNYQMENEKEQEKNCKYKRCFQNDCSNNICNYVCNLNQRTKDIYCTKLTKNIIKNWKTQNYINYCGKFTEMYECKKSQKLLMNYLPYNAKCPTQSEVSFNYTFVFLLLIFDSLVISFPWLYLYSFVKECYSILFRPAMIQNQNNLASKESTSNTSKIENNNNEANNSLNYNIERIRTRTIIIDNNNNIDINENNKDNLLTIKNNNSSNNKRNSKDEINQINVIDKDNSKSDIKLFNNKENILKVINQNNKNNN